MRAQQQQFEKQETLEVKNGIWPPAPTAAMVIVSRDAVGKGEVFWQFVWRMTGMGIVRGAILGAVYGLFFYIVGAVIGVFVGALAGLALGLLNGLILGVITCLFFAPAEVGKLYRYAMCLLSALLTFVGGLLLAWLVTGGWGTGAGNYPNGFADFVFSDWPFALLPSLIAALASGEAAWRVAKWYEAEGQ